MPSPTQFGNVWYLRVRVPSDLRQAANGRVVSLPVDGAPRRATIRDFVKVSLRTSDRQVAKARFSEAHAALQGFWQTLRSGPKPLSHKQIMALAGTLRQGFIDAFDENPGAPEIWKNVLKVNRAAREGRLEPLRIVLDKDKEKQRALDMDRRCGELVDGVLAGQGIVTTPESRSQLIERCILSLSEAARVNLAKAKGDYSEDEGAGKYPEFISPRDRTPVAVSAPSLTFEGVIDKEVKRRASGMTALPLRRATEKKYRTAASEFVAFRGDDAVGTVTAKEADAWLQSMLDAEQLSNNTISQRLQNLRTVVEWARRRSLGDLFPAGNPLSIVEPPSYQTVPSAERAFTLAEARKVLEAARLETSPDMRWLPWLCAYSGARINEVAQLTAADFFQVDDQWFYRLTTMGGKTLKTAGSERRVPVHPDLEREGLIVFVTGLKGNPAKRIFSARAQGNVAEWIRGKLGITRKELAPNHGWRHLFEDVCVVGGVLDAARNYITGRVTGESGEGYGRSEALLPGLMREMKKVPSYLRAPVNKAGE